MFLHQVFMRLRKIKSASKKKMLQLKIIKQLHQKQVTIREALSCIPECSQHYPSSSWALWHWGYKYPSTCSQDKPKIGIPLIKEGKQLMDMTCVENVALAIALALKADRAEGQVYNITNGERLLLKELIEEALQGLELPIR